MVEAPRVRWFHRLPQAAADTAGQALFAAGQLAGVFYTASCGGHSARPSEVWPGAFSMT